MVGEKGRPHKKKQNENIHLADLSGWQKTNGSECGCGTEINISRYANEWAKIMELVLAALGGRPNWFRSYRLGLSARKVSHDTSHYANVCRRVPCDF